MRELNNRPGLSELRYRIGTFGSFREEMLREIARRPELAALTSRESQDYGVAMVELWAYLADILTFYQERYVQEAFLRTATERDSLARMGALLAYKPRPGLAAECHVAFTVEAETEVPLEAGIRIMSVPGPGEQPRKYETVEPVVARQALNQLRVRPLPTFVEPLAAGSRGGLLRPGYDASRLRTGTPLLFTSTTSPAYLEKQVTGLTTEGERTRLTFDPPMLAAWNTVATRVFVRKRQFRLFGYDAPEKYVPHDAVPAEEAPEDPAEPSLETQFREAITQLHETIKQLQDGNTTPVTISVPPYPQAPKLIPPAPVSTDYSWKQPYLDLAGVYEGIKQDGKVLVVFSRDGQTQTVLATVTEVKPAPGKIGAKDQTPYSEATVTRIALDTTVELNVNDAVVYELGDEVLFWGAGYPEEIPATIDAHEDPSRHGLPNDSVYLLAEDLGMPPAEAARLFEAGRTILLADGGPPHLARVVRATVVPMDRVGAGHLRVAFTPGLDRPLKGAAAVLYGNVARASHGESLKPEVLGSGDPSVPNQSFTLRKAPVAFRPSARGSGADSSLTITVNDIRWTEVESFFGCGPADRVYVTESDGEGAVTVRFGDGVNGARLPRGVHNVVAHYRQGGGVEGAVRAGTLSALLDRPKGLRAAVNPGPATGGRNPETAADLRQALPETVRTFGRAVSLRDFEQLAITYPGVAKAKASVLWNGWRKVLHLTVAGAGGAPAPLGDLQAFLDARRDTNQVVSMNHFVPVPVSVGVRITVQPEYDGSLVTAAVTAMLQDYFAFDKRTFGEPVYRSDLYRAVQAVPGVAACMVDWLRSDQNGERGEDRELIPIAPARFDPAAGRILPAELAVVAGANAIRVERRQSL